MEKSGQKSAVSNVTHDDTFSFPGEKKPLATRQFSFVSFATGSATVRYQSYL